MASTTAASSSALLVAELAEAESKAATASTAAQPTAEAAASDSPSLPWHLSIGIGLWRLRLMLGSSCGSALVHFCVIIALAYVVAPEWTVKRVPPPTNLEAVILKPKLEQREPPKELEKINLKVEPSAKSVSPKNEPAKGTGSAGENGGRGGGLLGGLSAGIGLGPIKSSAGGTGSGIDAAFGTDMLGEVGEMSEAKATFFGIEAKGRKFVFVVDTSGSMRINQRFLRCRDELLRSVSAMQYGQQYFIVFFSDELYFMPENKFVDARPEQLQKTTQWLVGAVPSGGTEPWPGLQRAFRMVPDAIFLLTDGQFDPQVVVKADRIQPETKKKIPIHTIAFESPQGAVLLEAISKQSGGTHRFVP